MITNIEYITKNRAKIYIDESFAFVLTSGEIRQYGLKLNQSLQPELVDEILTECILKKAKIKALNLLKVKDRTEYELRKKLKEAFFPEEIINQAVDYVKSYHYIDDERFVDNYLLYQHQLSRTMIKYKLQQLGISAELLSEKLNNFESNDKDHIKNILKKKLSGKENVTLKEKQKIINYLLRKGYRYSDVLDSIKDFDINDNSEGSIFSDNV